MAAVVLLLALGTAAERLGREGAAARWNEEQCGNHLSVLNR